MTAACLGLHRVSEEEGHEEEGVGREVRVQDREGVQGSPREAAASALLPSLALTDTPNIVVPPEVVAGTEVEVSCMVPDNCPELRPELSWLGHENLGEPAVLGRLREDEGTWVQVSLLHFVPTREVNGHRLGCQATFPNTTLQFEGYASLDVKCEPGCGPGAGSGRDLSRGRGRVGATPLSPLHLPADLGMCAGLRPSGDCGDELLGGGHRGLPREPGLRGGQQPAAAADLDAGRHGAAGGSG